MTGLLEFRQLLDSVPNGNVGRVQGNRFVIHSSSNNSSLKVFFAGSVWLIETWDPATFLVSMESSLVERVLDKVLAVPICEHREKIAAEGVAVVSRMKCVDVRDGTTFEDSIGQILNLPGSCETTEIGQEFFVFSKDGWKFVGLRIEWGGSDDSSDLYYIGWPVPKSCDNLVDELGLRVT
jgi:hypothetical protein